MMSEAYEKLKAVGVDVTWLGGNCPVQAEGVIEGNLLFYFRARGSSWQFHIWPVGRECYDDDIFLHEEDFGEGFDAGWMEKETALGLMLKAAEKFKADEIRKANP